MVFIHGGTFNSDSGTTDNYGPERFLDYDIVRIVTIYQKSNIQAKIRILSIFELKKAFVENGNCFLKIRFKILTYKVKKQFV